MKLLTTAFATLVSFSCFAQVSDVLHYNRFDTNPDTNQIDGSTLTNVYAQSLIDGAVVTNETAQGILSIGGGYTFIVSTNIIGITNGLAQGTYQYYSSPALYTNLNNGVWTVGNSAGTWYVYSNSVAWYSSALLLGQYAQIGGTPTPPIVFQGGYRNRNGWIDLGYYTGTNFISVITNNVANVIPSLLAANNVITNNSKFGVIETNQNNLFSGSFFVWPNLQVGSQYSGTAAWFPFLTSISHLNKLSLVYPNTNAPAQDFSGSSSYDPILADASGLYYPWDGTLPGTLWKLATPSSILYPQGNPNVLADPTGIYSPNGLKLIDYFGAVYAFRGLTASNNLSGASSVALSVSGGNISGKPPLQTWYSIPIGSVVDQVGYDGTLSCSLIRNIGGTTTWQIDTNGNAILNSISGPATNTILTLASSILSSTNLLNKNNVLTNLDIAKVSISQLNTNGVRLTGSDISSVNVYYQWNPAGFYTNANGASINYSSGTGFSTVSTNSVLTGFQLSGFSYGNAQWVTNSSLTTLTPPYSDYVVSVDGTGLTITNVTISAQALTLQLTNVAPADAVTPKIWFVVTNGTSTYKVAGYQ